MLGSLYVMIEHLHDKGLGANILANLWINDFFLAGTLIDSLLHHARADSCHLRTMVGVHDSSYDVTTKGRTNLIEQLLIVLATLGIVVWANFQLCAVSCQTRGQR